jgi:hypothetical protein
MIAKIDGSIQVKWSDTNYKISYHFEKYLSGKGNILFSDYGGNTPEGLHHFFADRVKAYNQTSRRKPVENIARCFILSLPTEDKVSKGAFLEIADRYLEKMGYGDCPRTVFQHTDTKHDHIHIMVSTIDNNGKRVNDHYEKKRSFQAAREVEKEMGLTELKKGQQQEYSFMEDKHREYLLQQALRKAFGSEKKSKYLSFFTQDEIKTIRRRSLKNPEMEALLGNRVESIRSALETDNFFKKLYKDELLKKLSSIYIEYGKENFLQEVKKSGLYVRYTKGNLVYGMPDCSFYMKEQYMPPEFSYQNLKRDGQTVCDGQERERIFSVLCRFNGLIKKMIEQGILVKDAEGKLLGSNSKPKGQFGNFSFCNCSGEGEPIWISGNELGKKLGTMDYQDIVDSNILGQYTPVPFNEHIDTTYFVESLKNGLKKYDLKERLNKLMTTRTKQFVLDSDPTDRQVKALLNNFQYIAIDKLLYDNGLYNKHYKQQLLSVLDAVQNVSQIENYCNQHGIVMELRGKKLTYSFNDDGRNYSFSENQLPKNFSYQVLKPYLSMPVQGRMETQDRQPNIPFIPSGHIHLSPEGHDDRKKKKERGIGDINKDFGIGGL